MKVSHEEHRLLERLLQLRAEIKREGEELFGIWRRRIRLRSYYESALNTALYLALRRRDLRTLQTDLVPLGLSSLGRCEGHVLPSLDAVISALAAMCGASDGRIPVRPSTKDFARGPRLLERHARLLLGTPATQRKVRIMVTLPTSAANDYGWVRNIIERGTDCARINCAHDSAAEWLGMIRNIRRAERETGRGCKVLMDLCGPRARLAELRSADPARQRVFHGDHIWFGTRVRPNGRAFPLQATCSLPDIVTHLLPGATVSINEGRIGTRVIRKEAEGLLLEVTQAREKGEKLRKDMGLNFPGSLIRTSPLTPKDRTDLDFIMQHADAIGYSFVQEPKDMEILAAEIERRQVKRGNKPPLGIVAKIETERAVRNLPELIVYGAGRGPFGVMIARGDLAVEIGYLRIAEIQEEILWICEAARIPVIWATQVLDNLARKGIPSRAEITDAAMSERAECVMLNKGQFIPDAISILDQMLVRMQAHQSKKTATFRALRSWNYLWPNGRKVKNPIVKNASKSEITGRNASRRTIPGAESLPNEHLACKG